MLATTKVVKVLVYFLAATHLFFRLVSLMNSESIGEWWPLWLVYILLWGEGSKDTAFLYHGLCVSVILDSSSFCSKVYGWCWCSLFT